MTQAEIAALPDAELVRLVTELIVIPYTCRAEGSLKVMHAEWSPLIDWNDTMQVVAAMREKGFVFGMIESSAKDHVDIAFSKWVDRKSTSPLVICERSNEQRAILEAALMAAGVTDEPA